MIQDIEKAAACSVLYAEETSARAVRNFTAGVGRQYIGEIGKTDNGNVVVTTHRLGARSLGEETSPGSHRYTMAKKAYL
ncbi:hypothetical protein H1P_5080006 [Hyella patelloides LEGE 07179]|uniref:Uncharacterized protein n=1 Tax=Hyella patelloides LEGE 07179 TaxID=945734 RepID=A0A563VZP8_9CYAN|nr:hypothetical protein H1P_5080006 [Hyella patelloides LEGE 07179]